MNPTEENGLDIMHRSKEEGGSSEEGAALLWQALGLWSGWKVGPLWATTDFESSPRGLCVTKEQDRIGQSKEHDG